MRGLPIIFKWAQYSGHVRLWVGFFKYCDLVVHFVEGSGAPSLLKAMVHL